MAITHGIYTSERETSIISPIIADASIPVIVGAAPIHLVAGDPDKTTNEPILAYSFSEAAEKLGYSEDWSKYPLCEAMDYFFRVRGAGPVVFINVYDGGYTKVDVEAFDARTISKPADEGSVWVKVGGAAADTADYTVKYAETGFTITPGEALAGKAAEIYYHDSSTVVSTMDAAIIGGSSEGGETGLEAVRKVYPKLGIVPGFILAPGFSHKPTISAAMTVKTKNLNGSYNLMAVVDIDSGAGGAQAHTAVKEQKEAQGLNDSHVIAVWGNGKVGSKVYHGSVVYAAEAAYVDAGRNGVPYDTPSNKATALTGAVLDNGRELLLDRQQANEQVNSCGVVTMLNHGGMKLWGNSTTAYPGTTDVKERYAAVRRMFNWVQNSFIETFANKVDNPLDTRLIESVVDSFNQTGNYWVSAGYCAGCKLTYNAEENPIVNILAGQISFKIDFAPWTPAETIRGVFEFDPSALSAALNGE